jgi:hypothetical protein
MKRFPFLLLDAGPIIKLFELNKWEAFIERYEVTITQTVVEQCIYMRESENLEYINFPFEQAAEQGRIIIKDIKPATIASFIKGLSNKYDLHSGEDETLALLNTSSENYRVCAADAAVFQVLGFIGKGKQGISLEEALKQKGLQAGICWDRIKPRDEDWKYTKKFRERYTHSGEVDRIQGQKLV